jgi:hypothetical protein
MNTAERLREKLAELEAVTALETGRYDWFVTRSWNRLHYATLDREQAAELAGETRVEGPVRLACGRVAAVLMIPGVITRLGAMRCTGCCRATRLPPGKGSPKNDPVCRTLLGVD